MKQRLTDICCVFRIHLARLRAEAGPFMLAALVFPSGMYLFTSVIGNADETSTMLAQNRVRFLAGSIVFSLSLTVISWLGYLLLENRFTGRLKLFATLPLAPSSYVFGILTFALAQGALGTISLLGVRTWLSLPFGFVSLALVVALTMLCLCGLSVIIAARVRSFSEGSLLTDALGAGLVFLAPVYYAPEVLPKFLRPLAQLLPTAYAARAVQTTLAGSFAIGNELLALALMAIVTLSLGFRLMRWREE
jgi:ABC-type multidrug transport system permease subunit